jgi:hypothetical protein
MQNRACGVAQMIVYLPGKQEVLSANPRSSERKEEILTKWVGYLCDNLQNKNKQQIFGYNS